MGNSRNLHKSKMTTRTHLENGTFDLFYIVVDLTFSEPKTVIDYVYCLVILNLMGSSNNFSVVAKKATLGNSRNLHKSKMATRTNLEN